MQTTNADARLSSSRSPTTISAGMQGGYNEIMRSSPTNATRTTGPPISCTTQYENHQPSHTTSASSQEQAISKGKQRSTEVNDLATSVLTEHCHGEKQKLETVRSDRESVGRQKSDNTSVDQVKCHFNRPNDENGHRRPHPTGEPPSRISAPSRPNRNPLLIAQAHLSKAHGKPRPENSRPLISSPRDSQTNLRGSPENSREPPLLLSNITNPKLPAALHEDVSLDSSSPGPNIPLDKGELSTLTNSFANIILTTSPYYKADLQAKVLRRREVERSGESSQESHRTEETSYIHITPEDEASGVNEVEKLGTTDLEAKARVRARLRMKLTVEKHLHTPTAHSNFVDDKASEANIEAPDNREEKLRAALENRRR